MSLSTSFIFWMSCIILNTVLRLLWVENDLRGEKKNSSVFKYGKLFCSPFFLMCAVGKRYEVKKIHLKCVLHLLVKTSQLEFTNGFHCVSFLNQKLCSGNVYVHPQCLLLLVKSIWSPCVLAKKERKVSTLTFNIKEKILETSSFWICPAQTKK